MNAAQLTARALLACTLSVAAFTAGAGTANADPTLDGPECDTGPGKSVPVVPGSTGQLNVQGFQVALRLPIQILADRDVIGQTYANGPVTVTWPARWGPNDGLPFHLVNASQLGVSIYPSCIVNLAPARVPNT